MLWVSIRIAAAAHYWQSSCVFNTFSGDWLSQPATTVSGEKIAVNELATTLLLQKGVVQSCQLVISVSLESRVEALLLRFFLVLDLQSLNELQCVRKKNKIAQQFPHSQTRALERLCQYFSRLLMNMKSSQ